MSIDNVLDVTPRVQYTALAAQTDFDYPFPIFQDADLVVDVDGVTKTLSTHYTVTGEGEDTGGTVTFLVAMTGDEVVTIYRDIAIERTTDFQTNGPLRSATFNDELDRITMIEQQLEAKIGRSLRLPIAGEATDAQAELSPIVNWLGKLIGISAQGVPEPTTIVSEAISQSIVGELLNPVTSAEQSASATVVDFAIPNHEATGGVFYPERYGPNTTPGSTNMAAAIQDAINAASAAGGGEVRCRGNNYLGVTALTVASNVKLSMDPGAKFTANTAVVANMPMAYLVVDGNNVRLDGLFLDFVASPYVAYTDKGSFIQLKSGKSNIWITKCRSLWPMHSVYGVHTGAVTSESVSNVWIWDNEFVSHDADIYWNAYAPSNWHIYDNTFATQRPQELRNGGAIYFAPAIALETGGVGFDQTDYDDNCGLDIHIHNNIIKDVVGRPLRVHNCRRIYVNQNSLKLKHGTFSDPDVCDDAITCEMLRNFTVNGNSVEGGGENALDLQSCQDGVVCGNLFKECNTVAIAIAPSDLWITSATSPKLNGITDRGVINSKNIEISGNYSHSYHNVLFFGSGQNIHIHGNTWKVYTGSTYNDGTTAPLPFSIDTDPGADHFAEGHQFWMHNICIRNNKHSTNPWVSVTADAGTDLLTVAAGEHEFETGDPIELVPSGSSTTVDMPGGLTYSTTYYVIRASATTFQLATTRPNAFAGTEVDISSDGLTTVGSALVIRDAVYTTQLSVSASHYGADSNFELDPEFPYEYFITAFASFPVNHATNTTVLLKNIKNEFLFDPAATYGGGPSQKTAYPNRWLIDNRLTSDGTNAYGIEASDISRGNVTLLAAANISKYPGIGTSGSIRTTIW